MKTSVTWMQTVFTVGALLAPAIVQGQVPGAPVDNNDFARATDTPMLSNDFARRLFAPELIMFHNRAIGLSGAQRAAISEAVQLLQSDVVDPQWRLMESSQQLTELLESAATNEAQALLVLDQVLEAESEIKRANFSALIRIKNALTPEQQIQLSGLRYYGAYPRDTSTSPGPAN